MSEEFKLTPSTESRLEEWKKENEIFTHDAPHNPEEPWSAWGEFKSPIDFVEKFGMDVMGYGVSEVESIQNYCFIHELPQPPEN